MFKSGLEKQCDYVTPDYNISLFSWKYFLSRTFSRKSVCTYWRFNDDNVILSCCLDKNIPIRLHREVRVLLKMFIEGLSYCKNFHYTFRLLFSALRYVTSLTEFTFIHHKFPIFWPFSSTLQVVTPNNNSDNNNGHIITYTLFKCKQTNRFMDRCVDREFLKVYPQIVNPSHGRLY